MGLEGGEKDKWIDLGAKAKSLNGANIGKGLCVRRVSKQAKVRSSCAKNAWAAKCESSSSSSKSFLFLSLSLLARRLVPHAPRRRRGVVFQNGIETPPRARESGAAARALLRLLPSSAVLPHDKRPYSGMAPFPTGGERRLSPPPVPAVPSGKVSTPICAKM